MIPKELSFHVKIKNQKIMMNFLKNDELALAHLLAQH